MFHLLLNKTNCDIWYHYLVHLPPSPLESATVWKYEFKLWKYEIKLWKYEFKLWKYEFKLWKYEFKLSKYEFKHSEYEWSFQISVPIFCFSLNLWSATRMIKSWSIFNFIIIQDGKKSSPIRWLFSWVDTGLKDMLMRDLYSLGRLKS